MSVHVRPARRHELPDVAELLAAALGFTPADAVPAWLMRTTDDCGGLTLVAIAGDAVAGALHSIPGADRQERYLFTCGVAVVPEHRGAGVGRALMCEQRRRAAAAGCESLRWTAEPVNGRALRLYLTGLGARLVGFRAGLHDGLRADPGHPLDDVDIRWDLRTTADAANAHPSATVELPWSRPKPADRARVRAEMEAALAAGQVGTGVEVDHAARRCRVVFSHP